MISFTGSITLHPTNLTRSRPNTVHIPTLLGPDDAIQAPSFIFEKILVLGLLVDASDSHRTGESVCGGQALIMPLMKVFEVIS